MSCARKWPNSIKRCVWDLANVKFDVNDNVKFDVNDNVKFGDSGDVNVMYATCLGLCPP